MSQDEAAPGRLEGYEVSLGTILWVLAGSVFVLLRLAGVLSIPIGGVELDGLSGAWQAHAGNDDSRFVPTLFQGVTAWTFEFTSSEAPARWLAFIAGATVPLSLYRLRGLFGEIPALAAVVLLAFDPVSILLGSTAWAGAFDVPVVLWLLVLQTRGAQSRYDTGFAAFITATCGAVVLPFVFATAVVRLLRQDYPSRDSLLAGGVGVAVGIVGASMGFGFGWEGLTIPPIEAFVLGFDANWSSESTGYLALLYSGPLIAFGLAAAGWRAYASWSDQEWPAEFVANLTGFGISLAWLLVAGGSDDPVPLAAVAFFGAILLAREVPGVLDILQGIDWRFAILPLAGILTAAFIAEAYVVDWARIDRVGKDRDQLIVTGLVIAMVACVGLLASNRRTAGAIFLPVVVAASLQTLSGTFGVAFGGANEPLPSPISTVQGREIRDIALEQRETGVIAVHVDLAEAATWPFRDSGEIVLTTRIPDDANVAVWPATEPAPEGFSVLEGRWGLLEMRHAPDGGFLDYLRWLSNRNLLQNTLEPVTVYLRTAP